ncbi:unnamed protein product [Haemonchus placei]|uniref:Ovule protein n=1 Tax=Haemonchus placei TaxID=6290 RepID=A0A0N4WA81_HAEPC|nr:unnamed protein product [Haemonchus placei]
MPSWNTYEALFLVFRGAHLVRLVILLVTEKEPNLFTFDLYHQPTLTVYELLYLPLTACLVNMLTCCGCSEFYPYSFSFYLICTYDLLSCILLFIWTSAILSTKNTLF